MKEYLSFPPDSTIYFFSGHPGFSACCVIDSGHLVNGRQAATLGFFVVFFFFQDTALLLLYICSLACILELNLSAYTTISKK